MKQTGTPKDVKISHEEVTYSVRYSAEKGKSDKTLEGGHRREKPLSFTAEELVQDINFANSVASLCVTKRGAIPALPTLEETEAFVKANY